MVSVIDYAVVIAYLLLMMVVGFAASKFVKSSEDYLVAGRRLGLLMYVGCLAAVVLGGASTIGTAKLGYKFGLSGMWLVIMIGLGILALGLILANQVSKLKVISLSEMLEKRYNRGARIISAIITSIYAAMVAVTQVIGMGTVISVLMNWDLKLAMIVGGSVVVLYTLIGGMWSVSLTDMVQFVIMTVGIFLILLPVSLSKVGGFAGLLHQLDASYFNLATIGYDTILAYFLLFTLGVLIGQDIWQRVFTAKSPAVAKSGTIITGFYCVAYALACTFIGMAAAILVPNLDDPQLAFAKLSVQVLPPGLLGLVLCGVMSALMSTASGTILASSTLIVNDIVKPLLRPNMSEKELFVQSKITIGIIGLLTIVFAIWIQDVIVALDVAYALLSGCIFVPLVAGFFWKRATSKAAIWSIALSGIAVIAGLAIKGISSTDPIMYGIATSAVVLILVSLTDKEEPRSLEQIF